jgi:hypothetical protein
VLDHVHDGQEIVEKEIVQAGFRKTDRRLDELTENYFMEFEMAPATTPVGGPVDPSTNGGAAAVERALPAATR